jgi:PhzF family phenazine biosynthesis protein
VRRRFRQVDVFGVAPYRGNPVAVVLDGDGLTDEQMQQFSRWTNLSETTFVQRPETEGADYRARIFTTASEITFGGHPTLGTCHAWLEAAGQPAAGAGGQVVQQCGAGLVRVRQDGGRLSFAAPPLLRSGPAEEALVQRVAGIVGVGRADILAAEWADNGADWLAVLLPDAQAVLEVRPGFVGELSIGVLGLYPPGGPFAVEVRAFFPAGGATREDPVCGSLNAAAASWLVRSGRLTLPYVARQGERMFRDGRVYLSGGPDAGSVWVGGAAMTCVEGWVEL